MQLRDFGNLANLSAGSIRRMGRRMNSTPASTEKMTIHKYLSLIANKKTVLVAGMYRSGSTWLYNAVRLICEAAQPGATYTCWVDDFQIDAAQTAENIVVKLHDPDELLASAAWRTFTSHRDLRDVAASALDMGVVGDTSSVMNYLARAVRDYNFWRMRSQLDADYETVANEPERVLRRIAVLLDLEINRKQLIAIIDTLDHLQVLPEAACDYHDRITLLHPTHRVDGRAGRLAERLDDALVRVIEFGFGHELQSMGYQLSADAPDVPGNRFLEMAQDDMFFEPTYRQDQESAAVLSDWQCEDLAVFFDMAPSGDDYKVFSYLSGLTRQMPDEAFITAGIYGHYNGPPLRAVTRNVKKYRPHARNRYSLRPVARRMKKFAVRALGKQMRISGNAANDQWARFPRGAAGRHWFSNLDDRLYSWRDFVVSHASGRMAVVLFTRNAKFALKAVESLIIFSRSLPQRMVVVLLQENCADLEILKRIRSFGVRVLFDGSSYGDPRCLQYSGGLRFDFNDPVESPYLYYKAPAINWRMQIAASRMVSDRPEVILFVRPDWSQCGSATTFDKLTMLFHERGAIVVDVALQPYFSRYDAVTVKALLDEVNGDIPKSLYINLRSAGFMERHVRMVLALIRRSSRTIAGFMPAFYRRCVLPRAVKNLIAEARPDYLYVNHYFTLPFAKDLCPNRPVFLDTHDLQSINFISHDYHVNIPWLKLSNSLSANLKEELAIVRMADKVTMVNQEELRLAERMCPGLDIFYYVPVPIPRVLGHSASARPSEGTVCRCLIVASRNSANERSLEWFLRHIWPQVVRKGVELNIIGSIADSFGNCACPQVRWWGVVADLAASYREADLVLLPVTNGGGIAIKTLEAIMHEKPIAATRYALRGLPENVHSVLSASADAQELTRDIIHLIESSSERENRRAKTVQAKELLVNAQFDLLLHEQLDDLRRKGDFRKTASGNKATSAKKAVIRRNVDMDMHVRISAVIERYYRDGDRSSGTVYRSAEGVNGDGRPAYIDEMLARTTPHDEDYGIFRIFADERDIILDIGANWGYSAGSIWASGAHCRIISFEPLACYQACLERIAKLRKGRFDFRMVALGASRGQLRFVVPVVNGTAITALTSANSDPNLIDLINNIENHITEWMPDVGAGADIRLQEFDTLIDTLDHILESEQFDFPIERIVAIKVDVEGLEDQVIQGAVATIIKHKPLILAESGNRNHRLVHLLQPLGYLYTERQGEVLVAIEGTHTTSANGFFLHPDFIPFYEKMGILVAGSMSKANAKSV